MESEAKKCVKIQFGVPLSPEEQQQKKEEAKVKKEKKTSADEKRLQKSSQSVISDQPKKAYVVKYNILLGNSKFLRDLIVIGVLYEQ